MVYKRDLAVLLISACSIYFSLQKEGSIQFQKAWYIPIEEEADTIHDHEKLPAPQVADLNGDGHLEVLVATSDCKLQVYKPAKAVGASKGFARADLMAEASLLPERVRVAAGRRPVAMTTGYLDSRHAELVWAPRKMVVVVVTAGWTLLCFDHNLRLLWVNNLQDDFPHHAHIREVAMLVSNHTMRKGDRGVVVVGGSVELGDSQHAGAGGGIDGGDAYSEELAAEEGEEAHARARARGAELEELEAASGGKRGLDHSRHFSYYAFEGASGAPRWKHESDDFHRDAHELAEQLVPQHNYKLDAAALEGRHFGEVSCRDFRESVLQVMPHRWTAREDTRFELAHFRKHRRGEGPKAGGAAKVGEARRAAAGKSGSPGAHTPGKDHGKAVASMLGRVVDAAAGSHGSKHSPEVHRLHAPNVLVAHVRDGVEAIHLYSGRTLCKLHLPSPGIHGDLDGDGVLDHVMASAGQTQEDLANVHTFDGHHGRMPRCWATATSGVPVREQLFNGSICKSSAVLDHGSFTSRSFGRGEVLSPLEVATPALLPRRDGGHHRRKGHRKDTIFLNSRGEVTSYDPHGERNWLINAHVPWSNPTGSVGSERVVPTLAAYARHRGGHKDLVLVAGAHHMALLDRRGGRQFSTDLPAPPVLPLVARDFSGDRLNDLILVTNGGYYGYQQVHRPGGLAFSALLGCLIVLMAIIWFTQQAPGGGGGPAKPRANKRSTE